MTGPGFAELLDMQVVTGACTAGYTPLGEYQVQVPIDIVVVIAEFLRPKRCDIDALIRCIERLFGHHDSTRYVDIAYKTLYGSSQVDSRLEVVTDSTPHTNNINVECLVNEGKVDVAGVCGTEELQVKVVNVVAKPTAMFD